MLGTDKYAYQSNIKRVDPVDKLLVSFGILFACIFFDRWQISLAAFAGMIAMNIYFGGHTLPDIGRMLRVPAGFIALATLTIVLGRYSDAPLLGIRLGEYFYGMTRESLYQGFSIVAKSFGIIASMYFFVMNTTMVDFGAAMERLRVPKLFTELTELVYRFIFVLTEQAHRIKTAQEARLGYRDLSTSYRSTGILAGQLLLESLRRTDRIYDALESRGYQGELTMLHEEYERDEKVVGAGILFAGSLVLIFVLLRGLA